MRILIVDPYYAAFLKSHYAERPELAEASYDVQWRALMDRLFGTSDAYSHYLRELGHHGHEIVVNCEALQRAWAREHDMRIARRDRDQDGSIIMAQVEEYRPDVIYVQDLNSLPPNVLAALGKHRALLVGQIASETPSRTRLASFDLLVSAAPHFVGTFRSAGFDTEFIRLGFDPRVISRLGPASIARAGAVFVGALGRSRTWSSNAVLERAASRVPIDLWGYRAGPLPLSPSVKRRYRGEAWGIDMYRVLARSKIAVNRHGDVAGQHAINMRLYEATGVGALLITDSKADLGELFTPGHEVVSYTDAHDLVTKARYYLEHEREREAIAAAGQRRTLRDHTYLNRMSALANALAHRLR